MSAASDSLLICLMGSSSMLRYRIQLTSLSYWFTLMFRGGSLWIANILMVFAPLVYLLIRRRGVPFLPLVGFLFPEFRLPTSEKSRNNGKQTQTALSWSYTGPTSSRPEHPAKSPPEHSHKDTTAVIMRPAQKHARNQPEHRVKTHPVSS